MAARALPTKPSGASDGSSRNDSRESLIDLRNNLRRIVPSDELTEMLDESTIDDRVSNRAAQRWSRQIDEEEATWIGTLTDLAEQQRSVVISTSTGQNHRVVLDAVGPDVVVARGSGGARLYVRLEVIELLVGAGRPAATGTRSGEGATFHELLFGLSADRPNVSAATRSGRVVHGLLVAVGSDVLTIRTSSNANETMPTPTMIPLVALAEVIVHASS